LEARVIGTCRQWLIAVALIALSLPVEASAEGRSEIAPLVDAAKQHLVDRPEDAIPYVRQIEVESTRVNDQTQRLIGMASARWLEAEVRLRTDRLDEAQRLLDSGLQLIEAVPKPVKVRGDLRMSLGNLYLFQDRAAAALAAFQEAYRIFGLVNEPRSQAIALQNIGALYTSANDVRRAERYYEQAARTFHNDPLLSLAIHNSRGNALLLLERYGEAEVEFVSAAKIAEGLNKPLLEARVLSNLARNQVESRDLLEAEHTIKRAFALVAHSNAPGLDTMLFATAARLAEGRGDLARARRLIERAFDGTDLSSTSVELRGPHFYAYSIYRALGDYRRALVHLEALKRLSDESAKVATTNSAALMAARFDYANQELTIQKLTTEQLRKSAEFQRTLFLAIGGATLVVMVSLIVGLVTIRRSRNEVRAANAVLNETNVALEKALKAKTEFLATTSHEIRTPLNGILGMTQVMLADQRLDPLVRERVELVHGAGVTMRSLVDDILDVAKMETGNMTVDPVPMDFVAIMQEAGRLWAEPARAKGLGFDVDLAGAPGWIIGDPGRIRQMTFNLLSNAIKFTAQGRVGLAARMVSVGDGVQPTLQIVVTDTGVGIAADKIGEIFESFRQADSSTTREFGGTGLGLTICRNLAQALGGDISVTSVPGQGSSFTIELPLVQAEAPAAHGGQDDSAALLILDRNPIARSMLRALFANDVETICFAATPQEAADQLDTKRIAALVIDDATARATPVGLSQVLAGLCGNRPGLFTTLLWTPQGSERECELLDAGVSQVIQKPVSGPALVQTALPGGMARKSVSKAKVPLVSEAA
jgi:signal transduction histidine kinase